jgi:hypothetical protein
MIEHQVLSYFLQSQDFQVIFIKLWSIALKLQYTQGELASFIDKTQIPLRREIYEEVFLIIKEALQPTTIDVKD